MKTLYERIGGAPAVNATVELFYKKVLSDVRIRHFFYGIKIADQIEHQTKFISFAFGGPGDYSGRSLMTAHKDLVSLLGLNDQHFDAVIEGLGAALTELGVAEDLIQEAAEIAESVRDDVLNRDSN